MKSFLCIVLFFLACWYVTDLSSESLIFSVLAPIGVVLSFIALALWVVILFHNKGISQQASTGDVGGSAGLGDFGEGGDC